MKYDAKHPARIYDLGITFYEPNPLGRGNGNGSARFFEDNDTSKCKTFCLTGRTGFFMLSIPLRGGVAQLVRALPCHGRGYGFEPRHSRHVFRGFQ
jgi:hypothetical protein